MKDKLIQLGSRLKQARLERNDPQKEFAVRLGISVPTLCKMEKGDPSISIGKWVKALTLIDRIDDLDNLISPSESLFVQFQNVKKAKTRQRVRRTRN